MNAVQAMAIYHTPIFFSFFLSLDFRFPPDKDFKYAP